ncbi:SDR family NAD(P)-dependent oxidoreductase [Williamsia sterculiae]|uniref:SDR family NAD(P)-dependent oxidoreductase n=1 Tax=Williamsia sterculiae TaxID=1344003 RepID=UPI00135630D6|nr:SDR family NAD(P)-dependent oxidoreductase [Williamsia sterculiae]
MTGASSGIGEHTARALAAAGARVVLVARRAELVDTTAGELREHGHHAWAYTADLGTPDGARQLRSRVLTDLGVPDAIVNNAGAGRFLRIEETSLEEAVDMMNAPYFASFFTTRVFIEEMLDRGSGTIVMVNSPVAWMPWPGAVGYAAARYAVRGLTDALRQDLRGTGLVVGQVTPAASTALLRRQSWRVRTHPHRRTAARLGHPQ